MQKQWLVLGAVVAIFFAAWLTSRRTRQGGSPETLVSPKWTLKIGEVRSALAQAADGTIYSVDRYGILLAVSPQGEVRWRYTLGREGERGEPAIASDGHIYVVGRGKLRIITPEGQLKAEHTIRSRGERGIAFTESHIYGACDRGDVCSWSLDPYVEQVWRIDVGQNTATPLIHGYRPVIVGWNSVVALGARVSPPVWTYPAKIDLVPSRSDDATFITRGRESFVHAVSFAGAADGTTYVATSKGIIALDANGNKKWEFPSAAHGFLQPVVATDGTIFVLADARLYALALDGTKRWHLNARGANGQPTLGSSGTIFFTQGDTLRAIGSDGKEKWKAKLDAPVEGAGTLSPDGTLYVASTKGTLYAFSVGESLMASP